jgi:hypothetical protein
MYIKRSWCNIIVVNVHAPYENKSSFYEKLGHVFGKFHRYDFKILLGDLNAKVGREDIFKPTIWNESSYGINSFCVQTSCGAHPASCPMGTRCPFPGAKVQPGCYADHSPPCNPEVKNK